MNRKIAIYYLKKRKEVLDYALAIDNAINRGWISDGLKLADFDGLPNHLKEAAFSVYSNNLFCHAFEK